jgi:hypothetical protein
MRDILLRDCFRRSNLYFTYIIECPHYVTNPGLKEGVSSSDWMKRWNFLSNIHTIIKVLISRKKAATS